MPLQEGEFTEQELEALRQAKARMKRGSPQRQKIVEQIRRDQEAKMVREAAEQRAANLSPEARRKREMVELEMAPRKQKSTDEQNAEMLAYRRKRTAKRLVDAIEEARRWDVAMIDIHGADAEYGALTRDLEAVARKYFEAETKITLA